MNMDHIKKRVEKIKESIYDDEVAHSMEDALRNEFIQHVANVAGGDLAEMARAILSTEELDFSRWCG